MRKKVVANRESNASCNIEKPRSKVLKNGLGKGHRDNNTEALKARRAPDIIDT